MADRILTWHIPDIKGNGVRQGPTFFIEDDYEPIAVRVHAEIAPTSGDMLFDILDDGTSIFNNTSVSWQRETLEDSYLEYHALTGTFTLGEKIVGGTTSAYAYIKSQNVGHLVLEGNGTTRFAAAETITGQSSSATATVDNYVIQKKTPKVNTTASNTYVHLAKGDNTDDMAEDFNKIPIEKGSWLSLNIGQTGGAKNITVHLELERIAESDEE